MSTIVDISRALRLGCRTLADLLIEHPDLERDEIKAEVDRLLRAGVIVTRGAGQCGEILALPEPPSFHANYLSVLNF